MDWNTITPLHVRYFLSFYIRETLTLFCLLFIAWKKCTTQEKKNMIKSTIDRLDFLNDDERISAAKCLAFISLGNYGEYMGKEEREAHFRTIKENNQLLFQLDILSIIKQALNHGCSQLETLSM